MDLYSALRALNPLVLWEQPCL